MESITKNRQPEQTLRAMAERAYGPAQVPVAGADWVSELGHGWFNVAYLMRLRDGTVPAVHFADSSRELCDADWFFMDFVDADNLGITGPALPAAERDAYHEALGAANRELNAIRGPGDPSWRVVFTGMAETAIR